MTKSSKIDWAKLETEYITGKISLRELAEKHGATFSQVARYSSANDWVTKKQQYMQNCVAKGLAKAANKEANRLCKLIDANERLVGEITDMLADPKQFNRYIITEGLGGGATETKERIYSKKDTKAMRDAMSILKDATALMRDFYDIPTPSQREAQRIAAERFELERRRAEAESSDSGIEVVMLGEVEGWAE